MAEARESSELSPAQKKAIEILDSVDDLDVIEVDRFYEPGIARVYLVTQAGTVDLCRLDFDVAGRLVGAGNDESPVIWTLG